MKTKIALPLLLFVLGLVTGAAQAATGTWNWPVTRTDGTALQLSSIGGFTIYDTSLPVPGLPGTVIACPVTLPPTTATGTCTSTIAAVPGHTYGAIVSDTASPPDVSALSNVVTIPALAPPSAITNFTFR
jgi:hypothetical protein